MRSLNLSIRTIVSPNISAKSFRIAIIVILFIRHIISLSSYLFICFSNLTVPVVAYFHFLQVRATEFIFDSIHPVFYIDNIQGIKFLDFSNKSTLVPDLAHRATNIIFFTLRSTIMASDIDHHFPSTHLIT